MAQIVAALIRIGRFGQRRVEQRQPQHVVGGLVPAVLAVVQHRRAKRAARIGHVRPLLRRHFVMIGRVVAALNRAQAEIVSRFGIRGRERERRLEQRVRRAPVDEVLDVDAVAAIGQRHALHERRPGGLARDLERDARRARLDDAEPGAPSHIHAAENSLCPKESARPVCPATDRRAARAGSAPSAIRAWRPCRRSTRCRRSHRSSPCSACVLERRTLAYLKRTRPIRLAAPTIDSSKTLEADRRHFRQKQNARFVALPLENLHRHVSRRVPVSTTRIAGARALECHGRLDRIAPRHRQRVVDDEREARAARVEHAGHGRR